MKGFCRKNTAFSLCGLNCLLCPMHLGGHCPGCGGGPGNQSCAIARCSLDHGQPDFCWQCQEYPCLRYEGFDDYDSFLPHRGRQRDVAQAQAVGLEAYLEGLAEKRALLDALLAGYNDGRRKTFFLTAVSLLDLPSLRQVMARLAAAPEEADPKGRAKTAAALLRAEADRQGISLKLVKKPKGH